jgi:hypothetical protein
MHDNATRVREEVFSPTDLVERGLPGFSEGVDPQTGERVCFFICGLRDLGVKLELSPDAPACELEETARRMCRSADCSVALVAECWTAADNGSDDHRLN